MKGAGEVVQPLYLFTSDNFVRGNGDDDRCDDDDDDGSGGGVSFSC